LEGAFPDYEKIIPQSYSTQVIVDKEEFMQGIRLSSVFARETSNIVKMLIGKDLVLTAENPQAGSEETKIDGKIEGEQLEIAFNWRFISDFLNSIDGDEVKIELNGPVSPAVFRDSKDSSFLHLIMPIRIQE